MALVHTRRHHHLLLHCQRYPSFRRARGTYWGPFRNSDVLPPYGMHVALRQLEQQGPQRQVVRPVLRQHLHPGRRHFPLDRRHLRRSEGHHRCVRHIWRLRGMVLRGQLQLCMKGPHPGSCDGNHHLRHFLRISFTKHLG
jgi:hypothetical protein